MRKPNKYGCAVDHGQCKIHLQITVGWWGCSKATRKRDPVFGDIYVGEGGHRRILHVGSGIESSTGDKGELVMKEVTRVCYSDGGNHNHWCSLATFRSWAMHATLTKDGNERSSTGT